MNELKRKYQGLKDAHRQVVEENTALKAENFALSAIACPEVEGDEGGTAVCKLKARLAAVEEEREELAARFAEIDSHNVTLMEHVKGQDVVEQSLKADLTAAMKVVEAGRYFRATGDPDQIYEALSNFGEKSLAAYEKGRK